MKIRVRKLLRNYFLALFMFAHKIATNIKALLSKLKDNILGTWKKVLGTLKAGVNIIRNFDPLTFLEPKKMSVKEYSLYGIKKEENCHFSVLEIQKWLSAKYIPIDNAINNLDLSWKSFQDKSDIVLPIWAFKDLTPYISGVESLLIHKLPPTLESHIALFALEKPIELRVLAADRKGSITSSIVDVTRDKMIILEGSDQILEELQVFGNRFSFPNLDASMLSERIHSLLEKEHVKPLGSKLMLGGFGAIFAFELTFFYEKIISVNLPINDILALVLFSLTILAYLTYQIFDDSLVAYESPWTTKPYFFSMYLFLAFLVSSPFLVTANIDLSIVVSGLRIYSLVFILVCIIKDMGRTFFEKGLSKKILMIAWLALIAFFAISYIPL